MSTRPCLTEGRPWACLAPGPLVDGVVDLDNAPHILLPRVPALAPHCVVEHLLGRVDPHPRTRLLVVWHETRHGDRRLLPVWMGRGISLAS